MAIYPTDPRVGPENLKWAVRLSLACRKSAALGASVSRWRSKLVAVAAGAAVVLTSAQGMSQTADSATRADQPSSSTILPVEPIFTGKVGKTYKDSIPGYSAGIEAPDGAPNVVLIMTDDVGFGAASTFGGPVPTPNLDRLAERGLIYNRFHTTAMCSPTRAALLTGRNHHAVGTGVVTDAAGDYPGYNGAIPRSAATLAEILRLNGYNTAMLGKHHNVPPGETDPVAGPFDHWPTGLGFEHFYGFLGGDTNQWRPKLYNGTTPAPPISSDTETLDYFLFSAAINWLHKQRAAAPDKPFFLYIAPGTAHAPHQAPPEWIARFKGQFDQGWDEVRMETLSRQKAQGIVPADTVLTPRPAGIPAWSSLSPLQRRVESRMMETFAAMLAYQDYQLGRLLDELDRMGESENTLVMFIQGDNGGSAEGGINGTLNELGHLVNGLRESTSELASMMDRMGGRDSYQVYSIGWSWATNAPFQWMKQVGSHFGGTRNGFIVSWPSQIQARGVRSQFSHVTDIMPTVLEAAKLSVPGIVNGVPQQRVDGVSMVYSFNDPQAPEQRTRQYFELLGTRAIYDNGWIASTTPVRMPWIMSGSGVLPTDYKWELYNLAIDFSQAHDLADAEPARLARLKKLWMDEAKKNNVLPLDDRQGLARAGQALPAPRPSYVYWGPNVSVAAAKAPPINYRSFSIDSEIEVPDSGATGVLISYGSQFGGWSFHFEDGAPVVVHRASQYPDDQFRVVARSPLKPGRVRLRFDFKRDPRPARGGTLSISTDGRLLAGGRIAKVAILSAGIGETFDIGRDTGETVVDWPDGTVFNGGIERIEVKPQVQEE